MYQSKILCSIEHLQHIIEVCHKTNEVAKEAIGRFLLRYKLDPTIILLTTDHDEAISLYDKMVGIRIKRPREWLERSE